MCGGQISVYAHSVIARTLILSASILTNALATLNLLSWANCFLVSGLLAGVEATSPSRSADTRRTLAALSVNHYKGHTIRLLSLLV
jgi:hypothetical protein